MATQKSWQNFSLKFSQLFKYWVICKTLSFVLKAHRVSWNLYRNFTRSFPEHLMLKQPKYYVKLCEIAQYESMYFRLNSAYKMIRCLSFLLQKLYFKEYIPKPLPHREMKANALSYQDHIYCTNSLQWHQGSDAAEQWHCCQVKIHSYFYLRLVVKIQWQFSHEGNH